MIKNKLSINCLLCGIKMMSFFHDKNYRIFKCPKCGLGITEGVKNQEENYHRDEDYIKNQKQFENIYLKRVNLVNKFVYEQGKILEIGSSTGLMLKLFKKMGWDVLGIEISKKAGEFARKQGIATLITPFEMVNLPKKSFEAIVLNHTLEHLEKYEGVLEKVNGLLVSEGIIFIDVPNFGGLSAKILGRHWPYLLPFEHYWHFTFKSLSRILRKNNFKVVYCKSASGIWDYENPWLELWQSFSTYKKRFFINFLTMIPTYIISKFNQGSGLIVIAKKVSK